MSLHFYSDEEIKWLKENYKDISSKYLTIKFNERFDLNVSERAIVHQKQKYNLKTRRYGVNSYPKGNIPWNIKPIGSERKLYSGLIEVKVENPNKWKLKHRVIYEKAHGKIDKKDNIIFLDGDKYNFDIENLCLISNSENLIINKEKLKNKDPEITKIGVTLAKLKSQIIKISKK